MSTETKSVAELASELKTHVERQAQAVKEIAEKALAEAKKGSDLGEAVKRKADEALSGLNEARQRLADLEQRAARPGGGDERPKSLGERVTSDEGFKSWYGSGSPRSGKAVVAIKADVTTATSGAGGVGAAIEPTRLPGVQTSPEQRLFLRDLIAPGRTDTPAVEYVRESGFNNAAAATAEGAKKPQSDISTQDVTTTTKVIAHVVKVTRQALSDVSQLRSHIDNRLLYGLRLAEEQQMLFGDGAGDNLLGIVPQATAFSAAFAVAKETAIDKIRLALLQAELAEYPSTGVVMHPTDWARIETTKDDVGRYVIGNPQGAISKSLWNVPVVATPRMTVDKFLAGAFSLGAQVFDQWAASIAVGFENDDFTRNKVTILAEERLALAVYRPEAFVFGDLGYVA